MSVLITGATGFLGSNLARTLVAEGESVRALYRPNSDRRLLGDASEQIDWFEADLFDPIGLEEACRGVDTVYHCAAIVSFDPKQREAMLQINGEGTANVVNACLDAGVQALVHVSSVAAVGRPKGGEAGSHTIDEEEPWELNRRVTDYALSKHQAEREAWRGWAEGLPVLIVNPGTILGAGYWDRGTARFFSRTEEGLRFYTAGGTGFIDVRDVVRGCIDLRRAGRFGERFILVAHNATYRDLFRQIARLLDRPEPAHFASPALLGMLWRFEALRSKLTGGKPDITRQNAIMLNHTFRYNNSKWLSATSIALHSLSETLKDTALSYRQSRQAGTSYGLMPLSKP